MAFKKSILNVLFCLFRFFDFFFHSTRTMSTVCSDYVHSMHAYQMYRIFLHSFACIFLRFICSDWPFSMDHILVTFNAFESNSYQWYSVFGLCAKIILHSRMLNDWKIITIRIKNVLLMTFILLLIFLRIKLTSFVLIVADLWAVGVLCCHSIGNSIGYKWFNHHAPTIAKPK